MSWLLSRAVVLVFGTMYPAYCSYKAVNTNNDKEYVQWMMYWIVFSLFTVLETVTDVTLAWLPLYYEMKIAFIFWLLYPHTGGARFIYREVVHQLLSSREREIDDYIVQAREISYETTANFVKRGLTFAAKTAASATVKGAQL